ncbi:hypothetical protein AVKW3434_23305 [Acidovorax sp. SUPP3434]|nr:hypothetical protein AVKW3434_23305 [Acidovorax sp. SUPP3434]
MMKHIAFIFSYTPLMAHAKSYPALAGLMLVTITALAVFSVILGIFCIITKIFILKGFSLDEKWFSYNTKTALHESRMEKMTKPDRFLRKLYATLYYAATVSSTLAVLGLFVSFFGSFK